VTIETIQRHDPAFDQTAFLSRAEAVLALVLRARAEGRPEQARAVLSEDMAVRIGAELEGQRAAGRRQVHDGVRVRSAEIAEAASDGRWDTIAVRFSLEGAAYEAKADGDPVPGANRDRRRWAEMWWFQRKADATTSAADDAPLDRCPGCGAPLAPTSDDECAYCQRSLTDPSTWALTRITDTSSTPLAGYSAFTIDATPVARAARTAGVIVTVLILVLVLVLGAAAAAAIFASKAGKGASTPTPPTSTGFVTPVANPQVKASVNDVVAAAAALQAKVSRPVMLKYIYLYVDGRIDFQVQAADDPKGADIWTWKGGQLTGPEQAIIGVQAADLFPLAGLDVSNLARLCDAALGAVGIPDGTIESPHLLRFSDGLRWDIPVQSESRGSSRKTYRVAPDGTKPEVF